MATVKIFQEVCMLYYRKARVLARRLRRALLEMLGCDR